MGDSARIFIFVLILLYIVVEPSEEAAAADLPSATDLPSADLPSAAEIETNMSEETVEAAVEVGTTVEPPKPVTFVECKK